MEKNSFNKAYMYIIAIFAVGVAMANVIAFFGGVGFALIGASVLLFLALSNILKSENKKRFGDIAVLLILEFMMFVVLFFAYDFNINGITNNFPLVMRNICAIYSILAISYVMFRYISEIKGKRYKFVEYMLGNYTPQPRVKKSKPSKEEAKKNKELENGTLAPKPSSVNAESEQTVAGEDKSTAEIGLEDENEGEAQSKDSNQEVVENSNSTTERTGHWY